MLLISARGVRRYLHRLYRSMDHPDGKMGITVHVWGEDLTFFGTMSPKKAMCLALFLGSTAFWIGTGIGLSIFDVLFDVPDDVRERVLRAAYIGMVAMYASVMFAIIHVVFFRDRHAWTIDAIDRAL